MNRYVEDLLYDLPTLEAAHADDLKYEDAETGVRVWLSRVGEGVTVEHRSAHGNWEDRTDWYSPDDIEAWISDLRAHTDDD